MLQATLLFTGLHVLLLVARLSSSTSVDTSTSTVDAYNATKTLSYVNAYHERYREFNNKADHEFAKAVSILLSRHVHVKGNKQQQPQQPSNSGTAAEKIIDNSNSNNDTAASHAPTIIIAGLNKGLLLSSFLHCPSLASTVQFHGFEIDAHLSNTLRATYNANRSNIHIHNLGISNRSSVATIAGVGELSGLYESAAAVKRWKFKGMEFVERKKKNGVDSTTTAAAKANAEAATEAAATAAAVEEVNFEVETISLFNFTSSLFQASPETIHTHTHTHSRTHARTHSNLLLTTIDVEGLEALAIQGMQLERPDMRRRFSAIHYELGGSWVQEDPRRPVGSMNQVQLASYLEKLGYTMFLIGDKGLLRVNAEFFAQGPRSKDEGIIQGNALAVHEKYAAGVIQRLCAASSSTFLDILNRECS